MQNILASGLIMALVLACCGTANTPSTKDCGLYVEEGNSCFDESLATCTPARLVSAYEGFEMSIVGEYDSSSCDAALLGMDKSSHKSAMMNGGISESEAEQMTSEMDGLGIYDAISGKQASCVISKNGLSNIDITTDCSGPMIDAMMAIAR
jgi:hypothetical protein